MICGDGKPYRPGQVPWRQSPGYSVGNPRAMDGGPRRAVRSVLTEDWLDDYTASEHWSRYWIAVSAPSDD